MKSTNALALAAALCWACATVSAGLGQEPKLVGLPEITVHVVNGLMPGALPLTVDCQSAGEDLGYFELPLGEEFKWRFSNDIWAIARFYCSFWWDSKTVKLDLYTTKYQVKEGNVWFMADEGGILVKSDEHPDWVRQCSWGFNSDNN